MESLAVDSIPERRDIFEYFFKDIGVTDSESSGEQSPSTKSNPFLHTWFRTDDAMVLFLTNRTIQVDFLRKNRKIVINTVNLAISFIYMNECDVKQVITIKIARLLTRRFNSEALSCFKNLTNLLKYLSEKLNAAAAMM